MQQWNTGKSKLAAFVIALFSLLSVSAGAQTLEPMDIEGAPLAGKWLTINEIYIGTTAGNLLTGNDVFIELVNNTTKTQYLDGNVLVRFATGGKQVGAVLQGVSDMWQFPGKLAGSQYPVPVGGFVVIAASAKAYTGGLDLSGADFEMYSGVLDQDNAAVPNLTKVGT